MELFVDINDIKFLRVRSVTINGLHSWDLIKELENEKLQKVLSFAFLIVFVRTFPPCISLSCQVLSVISLLNKVTLLAPFMA